MATVPEMQENAIPTLIAYSMICKMQISQELGFWSGKKGLHMYFLQDDHPAMCQFVKSFHASIPWPHGRWTTLERSEVSY